MNEVQEIKVATSNGTFVIEIEKDRVFKFSVSPIDYPNNWIFENNKNFNTVEECFENALSGIKSYCEKNTINIYGVDNPCGCELISTDEEKKITKKLEMSLPVKMNGTLK